MKLWSLQVLRFVAALMVVYIHAAGATLVFTRSFGLLGQGALRLGCAGVDIFFVISGFVITTTGLGLSPREFLTKRARRILPLYLLMAAFYTATAAATSGVGWRDLVSTWLLWPATDRMTPPLVDVGWTLCFEALFYGAFAIVLWRRWALWPLVGIYLSALLLRSTPVTQFVGNPMVLEFLAGVGLALAPRHRLAIWALPLGAALLIAGAYLNWLDFSSGGVFMVDGAAWVRAIGVGIPSVLVVAGALQVEMKPGVLSYLGDASYSLYLVHLPIVGLVAWIAARVVHLPPDLTIVAAIVVSVVVSWRVRELFEKPVLSWLGRTMGAKRAVALAVS